MKSRPDPEQELNQYIDALDAEKRPEPPSTPEMESLFRTVRTVKALKEPAEPSPDFEQRLLSSLRGEQGRRRRLWWAGAGLAAVAAVLLLVLVPGLGRRDVVAAMVQAVEQVHRYHGVLEVRMANLAGEEEVVRTQEVWVEGDRYAIQMQDGTLTINNGEQKWQVRPQDRVVAILPVAPDPLRFELDLKAMAENARRYPHKVVGRDTVAGRTADIVEISPPGGDPYRIWVDTATGLPVQLVTPMQNALQTTFTYTTLEINQPFDEDRFSFIVPEGYQVVEDDPGLVVTTPAEAAQRLGFEPVMPTAVPTRMIAYQDRLVMEFGPTTVVQRKAEGTFRPATYGALGQAAGGLLEVLENSLRWRQGDLEITVTGPEAESIARSITPDLTLPDPEADFPKQPEVSVQVDMGVLENSQRQVDAGHMPYLLDPTMVTMSYLGSLELVLPDMDALEVSYSTGVRAIVEVPTGPISRVYLQRLVRQDFTGIWTVVGYDPR
ncbi:MAG TPA: sigma-E factor regulatory protein RseB domain-containing protein [Symbiobacteriaceae bacterium]